MVVWIIELVVLLIFVGFGGFTGFLVWAILSALVLFGRHTHAQAQLKAAELAIQAEKNQREELRALQTEVVPPKAETPAHLWTGGDWNIDFRTMTSGSQLIRRVSATQWEWKEDPDLHKNIVDAMRLLVDDDNEELRANARKYLGRGDPVWALLPERYIAAIETQYQRYLASSGKRDV